MLYSVFDLKNETPKLKDSAHLWAKIAIHKNTQSFIFLWSPKAAPSKRPWIDKAINKI